MNREKMGIIVGYRSHQGLVRESNEDAFCVLLPPDIAPEIDALLVVADGMGGHQAGEVASSYVVKTLEQLFSSSAYKQWVDYSPEREDYYAVVLKEVLERINERLYIQASKRQNLSGMGTTATVALLSGGWLFIGHVGDSRAYLLRKGKMKQLTQDHSLPAQKNVLTQALGNSLLIRVERSIHSIEPGDILVLCTDGLTNLVSDAEIQRAVQTNRDPQKACDLLVDLANRRGGLDNITVLVARVTGGIPKVRGAQFRPEVEESRDTQKILRREVKRERSRAINLAKVTALIVLTFAITIAGGALLVVELLPKVEKLAGKGAQCAAGVTGIAAILLVWVVVGKMLFLRETTTGCKQIEDKEKEVRP